MPNCYYNENDRFAAEWLRGLIAAGHIASGHVDERDIRDVRPDDLAGYTQCHFFAGIGGWSRALRLAGWSDDRPVWTGSCPCQPFSSAGRGGTFEDPRHLWPAWFRLIRECRPPVVLGEQVANRDGVAWFDHVSTDLEAADYAVGAADLCAASVGAPHIRQRLFFVGHAVRDGAGQHARELPRDEAQHEIGAALGDHASLDPGADGAVANPRLIQRGTRWPGPRDEARGRPPSEPAGPSDAGLVGNADGGGEGALEGLRRGALAEPARGAGELDDADGSRLARYETARAAGAGEDGSVRGTAGHAREPGVLGQLGDAARERCGEAGPDSERPAERTPGAGHWDDLVWLDCRDGKRRPTKPGLFPLAHGIPGRVGILRGSGNAIVPQVAAAFIQAYEGAVNR